MVTTLRLRSGQVLGSANLTIDASGVVSSQRYKPFGEVRTGSVATDLTFTGQRRENQSYVGNLMDYGARMYSPGIGRFISADTIVPGAGNPQSLNRYSYVNNRPLNMVDPTGHDPAGSQNNCNYGGDIYCGNQRPSVTNGVQQKISERKKWNKYAYEASMRAAAEGVSPDARPTGYALLDALFQQAVTSSDPTPEMKLYIDWWFGTSERKVYFGPGSDVARSLESARGVQQQLAKYRNSFANLPKDDQGNFVLDEYFNYGGGDHFRDASAVAGGDWRNGFYGSYRVKISSVSPADPLTVKVEVINPTSWDSGTRISAMPYLGPFFTVAIGPNHGDASPSAYGYPSNGYLLVQDVTFYYQYYD